MGRNKLKSFIERIKRWKPIHLCWLFEKLGLAIPKYLIGAATGTVVLAGSRIANATRTWQADEDLDVSDWVKTADFIYAIAVETEPGKKANKNLSIRWRNKTDSGSFVALSGTGELTWTAVTDLENGTAVTSGEAGCTPSASQTWMDGTEREGDNDVTFNSGVADIWSEYHWAIDCSNAHDGDEYEFEIYSVSNGIPISTCASTITMESAGVTVSPTPASAISTALISAIVLGSLIISPTAAASIGEKVNPTVVLGSTLIIPAPAESVATTINPTVVKGSLTVSPNPAEAVAAVVDPGIVYGSTTATPDPASSVGAKADPTVVKGSLTLLPSPTEVVAAVVDPTVVISGLQITPDPASAVSSTVNPTVLLGSTSIIPDSASAVSTVVDPTVILPSMIVTPDPVNATATTVNPTVVLPSMTVTPDPADSVGATENPIVIKGSLLLSPTAASSVGVTINPIVIFGSTTAIPDSASAVAAVVDPTVVIGGGGELVTPGPASTVAGIVNPTVLFGSTSVTPLPTSAIGSIVNPTVVKGSLSISPNAASAVASVVAPTIIKGSLLLTPTPTSVVADTVNPTVVLGSVLIIPSSASAIGERNNPVIILGSTSVTPGPVSVIGEIVNPVVILPSMVVIPGSASVVADIVNPIVILGDISVVPNPASAISSVVDPIIILGSISLNLPSADAVAAIVNPTVFEGLPVEVFLQIIHKNASDFAPNTGSSISFDTDHLKCDDYPITSLYNTDGSLLYMNRNPQTGRIWVKAAANSPRIKYTDNFNTWNTVNLSDGDNRPSGFAVDNENNLYLVPNVNGPIKKYNSSGTLQWTSVFNGEYGIFFYNTNSHLYVCDYTNAKIREINKSGDVLHEEDISVAHSVFVDSTGIYILTDYYLKIYELNWDFRQSINVSQFTEMSVRFCYRYATILKRGETFLIFGTASDAHFIGIAIISSTELKRYFLTQGRDTPEKGGLKLDWSHTSNGMCFSDSEDEIIVSLLNNFRLAKVDIRDASERYATCQHDFGSSLNIKRLNVNALYDNRDEDWKSMRLWYQLDSGGYNEVDLKNPEVDISGQILDLKLGMTSYGFIRHWPEFYSIDIIYVRVIANILKVESDRQVAYAYQDITVTGSIQLNQALANVGVKVEVRKKDDNTLMATLINTSYNFGIIEASLNTINGGSDPTWNVGNNIGEFYLKTTLLHANLEGNKEDKEYFYAGGDEPEPEFIELVDGMQIIEIEDEELGLIELE